MLLQLLHAIFQIPPLTSLLNPLTDSDVERSCLQLAEIIVTRQGTVLEEGGDLCITAFILRTECGMLLRCYVS